MTVIRFSLPLEARLSLDFVVTVVFLFLNNSAGEVGADIAIFLCTGIGLSLNVSLFLITSAGELGAVVAVL